MRLAQMISLACGSASEQPAHRSHRVRRRRAETSATAISILSVIAVVALGGCSSDGESTDGGVTSTTEPASAAASTTVSTPQRLPVGSPGDTRIAEVTLHGIEFPVDATGPAARIAPDGKTFAVADLTVCPKVSNEPGPGDFFLIADNSLSYTFWNVQTGAKDPNLTQSLFNATPGLCVRGYLSYPVSPGSKFTNFAFVDRAGDQIVWTVQP